MKYINTQKTATYIPACYCKQCVSDFIFTIYNMIRVNESKR